MTKPPDHYVNPDIEPRAPLVHTGSGEFRPSRDLRHEALCWALPGGRGALDAELEMVCARRGWRVER